MMMEGPGAGQVGAPTSGLHGVHGTKGSIRSQQPGRRPALGCPWPPVGSEACSSPLASPPSPTHGATGWLLADPGVQLLLPDFSPGALPHQAAGLCDLRHFWAPQLRRDPPTQNSSRTPGPKTWGDKAIAVGRCPPWGGRPGNGLGTPTLHAGMALGGLGD